MSKLNNILFPVDFSRACENVAQHALTFARYLGAHITIVNVLDLPSAGSIGVEPFLLWTPEQMQEMNQRHLGALARFVQQLLPHADVRAVVREGEAASTITAVAAEVESDLLMMPTRGLGPFRRYLLGSVTAKVLHDSPCAVWTSVHREEDLPPRPLSEVPVVCAINLEPESISLLEWASGFAAALGAELRVLHVIPAVDEESQNRGVIAVRKYLSAKARDQWSDIRRAAGVSADLHVAGGNIAHTVASGPAGITQASL